MKIAVVGLGYWGPNLVRNFLAMDRVETVIGCDADPIRLKKISKMFPAAVTSASFDSLLEDDSVNAIALATPVSTHYPMAKRALAAGKHVLIEKPMTTSVEHARILVQMAADKELILMVDHTFIYTGAVRKLKELTKRGDLGEFLYFDSVRVNLGLFQQDTNVIWDLAPHDVSIMEHLIDKAPLYVTAVGANHFSGHEDMAYVSVHFEDKTMAHFHVNWLSPVKIRKILLAGSKKMIVYDDMEPSEKIKVYDKGVEINSKERLYKTLIQYRTGDMSAPQISSTEALKLVTREFITCIQTGKRPLSDGGSGLKVVQILEAADQSLKDKGRPVYLEKQTAVSC